jgi:hypothetical protein
MPITLDDYRNEIAFKMNYSTSDADELERVDAWVNRGYEDILLRTQCKVCHGTMTTTEGEWRYALPTNTLDILEIWLESDDGSTTPFEKTDSRHLIRMRAGLETEIGSPPRYFATDGSNMFMLWPTPSSTDTINVLYVPRPTALSATADTPTDIPNEFHEGILWYALWQAADADDDSSSQMGEYYRSLYEGRDGMGGYLDRIRKHNRRRGGRRLSPVSFSRGFGVNSRSADLGWR